MIHKGRKLASGREIESLSELKDHLKPAIEVSGEHVEEIRKLKEEFGKTLYFLWRLDALLALAAAAIEHMELKHDDNGLILGGVQEAVGVISEMVHARQEIMDLTERSVPDIFDKMAE